MVKSWDQTRAVRRPLSVTEPLVELPQARATPKGQQANPTVGHWGSAQHLALFPSNLAPVEIPPPSGWWACAKLTLTLLQAVPMVASVRHFARMAPQMAPDAPEGEGFIPRQTDIKQRQETILINWEQTLENPALLRGLTTPNNRNWLASGFQVVLGAGFFGMYQHAGAMRALASMGLHPHIREICGLSSGAITGALYGALGPEEMTQTLLNLSLLDFLDLSITKLIQEGALCEGKAIERKLALELGRFGCTQLEDVLGPKLRLAVFDGAAGRTFWRTEGPLAQTVAQSAALPVLFAHQGIIDGGWVDHHGLTAMVPGQRALSLRINTGLEPDAMQRLVHRPTPLFNVSEDPEHKTVALKPRLKIDGSSFLFDIDFRKQKLAAIMTESEEMLKWWLMQPEF